MVLGYISGDGTFPAGLFQEPFIHKPNSGKSPPVLSSTICFTYSFYWHDIIGGWLKFSLIHDKILGRYAKNLIFQYYFSKSMHSYLTTGV